MSILIGYVHGDEVKTPFMQCVLRDAIRGHADGSISGVLGCYSSANICLSRNLLVNQFREQSKSDWLLMVDTDMVWDPDVIPRLAAVADPETVPVVGALCYGLGSYGKGGLFPTIYTAEPDPNGNYHYSRVVEFPEDTLTPVVGTGAAFLLVHRSAFDAVPERDGDMFRWFSEERIEGHAIGEDLVFCRRLGEAGVPVHVHTGITVGHLKPIVLTHQMYRAEREARAQQKQE